MIQFEQVQAIAQKYGFTIISGGWGWNHGEQMCRCPVAALATDENDPSYVTCNSVDAATRLPYSSAYLLGFTQGFDGQHFQDEFNLLNKDYFEGFCNGTLVREQWKNC